MSNNLELALAKKVLVSLDRIANALERLEETNREILAIHKQDNELPVLDIELGGNNGET